MYHKESVQTGLKDFDSLIDNLRYGDNVIWQITNLDDYRFFVNKLVAKLKDYNMRAVYIKFSGGKNNLIDDELLHVVEIFNADTSSFESFTISIYRLVEEKESETFYIFDCLSELIDFWAVDWMIANFFKLICPLLYIRDTVAYFAVYRNHHSLTTVSELKSITQLFVDVYKYRNNYYVHPVKVYERHSPQMFLPHKVVDDDTFEPVTNSYEACMLFSSYCYLTDIEYTKIPDAWDRLFLLARKVGLSGTIYEQNNILHKIFKVMFTKDTKIIEILEKYFTIHDVLLIKNRMIGTGFIGGKAVGMLLGRKILEKDYPEFSKYDEPHDSFFIGSGIFYEYIIYNGWWDLFVSQKTDEGYFPFGEKLARLFLKGDFPENIIEKFIWMLSYFGQYPIVIRSSSLLEDGFGNAFAGKYESFFSCTSGSPEKRLEDFLVLLKKVYSSIMSKEALIYRKERGLDKTEELMSILVQRVSGSFHNNYFFPDMAGVGLSLNTYVWHGDIKPEDGMLRVVLGLGTRAVNTNAEDYSRIISLSHPELLPISDVQEIRKYSQKDADLLEVNKTIKTHLPLFKIFPMLNHVTLNQLTSRDYKTEKVLQDRGRNEHVYYLSFKKLLAESNFVQIIKKMLKTIEKAYGNAVDTEFAINFYDDESFRINLVQCRPLQTKTMGGHRLSADFIENFEPIIKVNGNFMGGSILQELDKIIYVPEKKYNDLSNSEKYELSRRIGDINRKIKKSDKVAMILPGRIGTTTPSLGVPVSFSEINRIFMLVEVGFSDSDAAPELSFGTHFFQDLVESGIFYMVVYPKKAFCDFEYFSKTNCLQDKDLDKFEDVVNVYDVKNQNIYLYSDIKLQVAGIFKKR